MGRVDLANLTPDEGFKIAGASDVGLAGDINNDGIDDFVVSAEKSYVIFGKAGGLSGIDLATLTPDQGFVVSRTVPGDDAGVTGGATGDFNGDGIDDVIFGSPFADAAAGVDAGQAYVVFGSTGGPGDVDVTAMPGLGFAISGGAAGDWAGTVATSAGDFNGDGIDDILVNARKASPDGRIYAGESYVIYGQLGIGDIDLGTLTADRGFRIAGESDVDYAGEAASSAGDINGDGFDDIILGAPFFSFGIGRAYVIYGNAAGSGNIDLAALAPGAGFKITGDQGNEDFLGRAVVVGRGTTEEEATESHRPKRRARKLRVRRVRQGDRSSDLRADLNERHVDAVVTDEGNGLAAARRSLQARAGRSHDLDGGDRKQGSEHAQVRGQAVARGQHPLSAHQCSRAGSGGPMIDGDSPRVGRRVRRGHGRSVDDRRVDFGIFFGRCFGATSARHDQQATHTHAPQNSTAKAAH